VAKPKNRSARRTQRPRPTRASSRSREQTAAPDDDDDDDDDEIPSDEALALFLRRPPAGADRFVVVATSHSGDQTLQDRPAVEARRAYVQMANMTIAACDRWAHSEGRECRFRAIWQQGERALATHQWRAGSGDPQALNGTVESFLSQVQRHLENREGLSHDNQATQLDGWKTLSTYQNKRIEALEKDNAELRERLRRVDDVGSEIALEQARAELQQRGRTADILEQRVLPIAQAYMLQMAQKAAGVSAADGGDSSAAPPLAGNSKP
jgi:hypothetical protein